MKTIHTKVHRSFEKSYIKEDVLRYLKEEEKQWTDEKIQTLIELFEKFLSCGIISRRNIKIEICEGLKKQREVRQTK